MALTTIQGVIDGLLPPYYHNRASSTHGDGRWHSSWYVGPAPVAGGSGAAIPGGTALTAPVTGQLPFTNPVSGESVLARTQLRSTGVTGDFLLCDRLWHASGFTITSTSAQTVNSTAWPARDINQSANGRGVYVAVQISSTVGAGTPVLTMSYTNSDGTAGRTGTNIFATAASVQAGVTYFMGLQEGDTGVRSVQSLTLSASWTSGAIQMVAYRPIAFIPGVQVGSVGPTIRLRNRVFDALQLAAPRIWNGSVLDLLMYSQSGTANTTHLGAITLSQG